MRILPLLSVLPLAAMATAQWHPIPTATSPTARFQPSMAYDVQNGRTILYGGAQILGFGNFNNTWSFDGSDWTLLAPVASPSARSGAEMVHDLLRGVMVMYGGNNSSPFGGPSINQTWEFDGATWTQITPANTPGGLSRHGMAYDIARSRTVVYGGLPDGFFPIDSADTWEYDGVNWTHVTTANSPGPLENHAMCYSPALGKVVLFGGIDVQIGGNNTTWGYDGINWTPFTVVGPSPSARVQSRMCYDTDRGVCVLQGGLNDQTGNLINETWEFNGTSWTQRAAVAVGRQGFGFAFDQARHAAVLTAGADASFNPTTGTQYYGALLDSQFGAGCPGTNGVPVLAATTGAHIAANFQTTMSGLLAGATLAVRVTGFAALGSPLSLAPFGLPGCTAYATVDDVAVVSAGGGLSTTSVAVPNNPSLAGGEFWYTGLSFDTVNAFGGVLSNTLHGYMGY